MVGLYLSQIGEFSLVLLTAPGASGIFSADFHQMALSIILMTMIAAPFVAMAADRAGAFTKEAGMRKPVATELSDHTVVIGYGLNGRNVASSLRSHGLPYAILEMNPQTVRAAQKLGEPIFYGDAVSGLVLEHVGMSRARCAVLAISDPIATRQAVAATRRINPDIYIVARTRYISEIDQLYAAGADTVITEEFETSLEIIRRILGRFGYRPSTIDREVLTVRQRRYRQLRGKPTEPPPIDMGTGFEPFEVEVRKKSSGKTVTDLRVREQTGATIIAVRRGGVLIPNPDPQYVLNENDHVYLIGSEEEIRRAMRLL
jgi:CPA2 family monovalent cation:H+ antiporter-2